MIQITEFIQYLEKILKAEPSNRIKDIKAFQEIVWGNENLPDTFLNEVLSEMAYDLDFYEPIQELRKESPNYYGNDHLEEVVRSGIDRMKVYLQDQDSKI